MTNYIPISLILSVKYDKEGIIIAILGSSFRTQNFTFNNNGISGKFYLIK